MASSSSAVDAALRRVFAVSLAPVDAAAAAASDPPIVYLADLAQELASERQGGGAGAEATNGAASAAAATTPTPSTPLLAADDAERALVARLIEAPPPFSYPQPPFHYLLGCYARAVAEQRAAGGPAAEAVAVAMAAARELVASYAALALPSPPSVPNEPPSSIVPQSPAALARGALQLVDSFAARDRAGGGGGGGGLMAPSSAPPPPAGSVPLPPGFLEEFCARCDPDQLAQVLRPVASELARRVQACSPLGDYSAPLSALRHLCSIEPAVRALASMPTFLPDLAAGTGRAIELPGASWLGPCFSVSPLPDPLLQSQPSVIGECFAGGNATRLRQSDLTRANASLRASGKHLTGELHAVIKALLGKGTRERALDWLALAIEGNARERSKMQMDPRNAASNGFFVNLSGVLLRLCGPFLDPSSPAFWQRVDVGYVTDEPNGGGGGGAGGAAAAAGTSGGGAAGGVAGARLSFREDTKLGATVQQEEAYVAARRAAAAAGGGGASAAAAAAAAATATPAATATTPSNGGPTTPATPATTGALSSAPDALLQPPPPPSGQQYHFICEAYFMALKSLHLGVVKIIDDTTEDVLRRLQRVGAAVQQLEQAVQAAGGPGSPAARRAEIELARMSRAQDALTAMHLCSESVLADPEYMADVLALYRLHAAWLLRLACPGGQPSLPLADEPPASWRLLPEWFVEDMAEVLLYTTRAHPQLLAAGGVRLDEMMLFLVVFIGGGRAWVRSPYLRSKLSEVLHAWLPPGAVPDASGGEDDGGDVEDDGYGGGRGGFGFGGGGGGLGRGGRGGGVRGAGGGDAASLAHLFQAHPLVLGHLVPALLGLYADIEHAERAGQFYIKFNMRQYIGDVLAYLWGAGADGDGGGVSDVSGGGGGVSGGGGATTGMAAHREAWRRVAAAEGGRGAYLRFANVLVNDSIYLLDEALKKLRDLRAHEARRGFGGGEGMGGGGMGGVGGGDPVAAAAAAAWAALPAAEREEAEAEAEQTGDHLRSLLHLAAGTTRTLAVATRDPRAALPFLLPEMAPRVAAALDYFLLYLTGPERRNLKVREPEKYNFRPKRLLRRICAVYLNLFRADRLMMQQQQQAGEGGGGNSSSGSGPGAFARAIAADERSYRPDMFAEAALVLRQFDLMDEQSVRLLEDLAASAAEAARDRRDDEEAFEGAPEEFLDPILAEVMRDPVRLPTSGKVVDRATITRVLLTDPFDPFSRAPLTAEQLEPVPELKARLEAWKREQREARRTGGGGGGGGGVAPME